MAGKCEINLESNEDIQSQWFSNQTLLFRTYSKLYDRNQGYRLYFQDNQITYTYFKNRDVYFVFTTVYQS